MIECCKFKEFDTPFLCVMTEHTFEDALVTKIPEYSELLLVPEETLQKPKKKEEQTLRLLLSM